MCGEPSLPRKKAAPSTPTTDSTAIDRKRRSSGRKWPPVKAWFTLVSRGGKVSSASASASGTRSVMIPMAMGGMPMPIAPLATPATVNATAITRICSVVIVFIVCPPVLSVSRNGGVSSLSWEAYCGRAAAAATQHDDFASQCKCQGKIILLGSASNLFREAVEGFQETGPQGVLLHHDLVQGA